MNDFVHDCGTTAQENMRQSLLQAGVGGALDLVGLSATPVGKAIYEYAPQLVTSAAFFLPGKKALWVSGLLGIGNEVKMQSSASDMAIDALCGFGKGMATKAAFDTLGERKTLFGCPLTAPVKGIVLGTASRFVDVVGSRKTWLDDNGSFDLATGGSRVRSMTLNKEAAFVDAAVFGITHLGSFGLNKATSGALERSKGLNTMITGWSFGAANGGVTEALRQRDRHESLDLKRIALCAAGRGALDLIAAIPGGMVHGFRPAPPGETVASGAPHQVDVSAKTIMSVEPLLQRAVGRAEPRSASRAEPSAEPRSASAQGEPVARAESWDEFVGRLGKRDGQHRSVEPTDSGVRPEPGFVPKKTSDSPPVLDYLHVLVLEQAGLVVRRNGAGALHELTAADRRRFKLVADQWTEFDEHGQPVADGYSSRLENGRIEFAKTDGSKRVVFERDGSRTTCTVSDGARSIVKDLPNGVQMELTDSQVATVLKGPDGRRFVSTDGIDWKEANSSKPADGPTYRLKQKGSETQLIATDKSREIHFLEQGEVLIVDGASGLMTLHRQNNTVRQLKDGHGTLLTIYSEPHPTDGSVRKFEPALVTLEEGGTTLQIEPVACGSSSAAASESGLPGIGESGGSGQSESGSPAPSEGRFSAPSAKQWRISGPRGLDTIRNGPVIIELDDKLSLTVGGRKFAIQPPSIYEVCRELLIKQDVAEPIAAQANEFQSLLLRLDKSGVSIGEMNDVYAQAHDFVRQNRGVMLERRMRQWVRGQSPEVQEALEQSYGTRARRDGLQATYFTDIAVAELKRDSGPYHAWGDLLSVTSRLRDRVSNGEITDRQARRTMRTILALVESGQDPRSGSTERAVDSDAFRKAALQAALHAADPQSINQHHHPTCALASLEVVTYQRCPEIAASLVSEVLRTGRFVTSSGAAISVDPVSLLQEAGTSEYSHEIYRSFANQIFQMTAANIHWQTTALTPDGSYHVTPGRLVFELQFSPNPDGGRPVAKGIVRDVQNGRTWDEPGYTDVQIKKIGKLIDPSIKPGYVPATALLFPEDLRDWLVALPRERFPIIVVVDANKIDPNVDPATVVDVSPHAITIFGAFDILTPGGQDKNHVAIKNSWNKRPVYMSIDKLWEIAL